MELPDKAVRTAAFGLLSLANIQSFDSYAPVDAVAPYVLLLSQSNEDYSTKSGYGFYHDLTISAVTVGPNDMGREGSENLLNQSVLALTTNKPGQPVKIDLSSMGFRCWLVKVGKARDLSVVGDTEAVFQKIVTLTLNIECV